MNVAFVYDRVAPETLGGAERFYATLTRSMALGQPVTYVTRRYGSSARTFERDGVRIVTVSRARPSREGAITSKLRFALGVARHMASHGGRYDVVHVCCFPHVAVLAARLGLLAHRRTRLVVDFHEVLPRSTWRRRLGRAGDLAWLVQRAAIASAQGAITFSRMHEQRLREEGYRRPLRLVPEFLIDGVPPRPVQDSREPLVVFAGRLVPEKQAHLLPLVVASLRDEQPDWRGIVFGTGPSHAQVAEAATRAGVSDAVHLAGYAPWAEVSDVFHRARALVLPTTREGFGLVVLEAAAHGLPSVLVAGPDNAAVELIEAGVNGVVVGTDDPRTLAAAVLRLAADPGIHAAARSWYEAASTRLNVGTAAREVRELHREVKRAKLPC